MRNSQHQEPDVLGRESLDLVTVAAPCHGGSKNSYWTWASNCLQTFRFAQQHTDAAHVGRLSIREALDLSVQERDRHDVIEVKG